jgi:Ca2+-binding EF-hand superfamily protein
MHAMSRMIAKKRRFVVCVQNTGYPASLELRKIYQALPDADAEVHNLVRVIDESGEDYLYPKKFFRALDLPQDLETALRRATG